MKKPELIASLRRDLQALAAQRRATHLDPVAHAAREALRRFQSERMAATHADLLADPRSAAAARFFLDDLYGAQDVIQRDADIERVLPTMERLLPLPALAAIAEAIELDALSDALDAALAARLGAEFDAAAYAAAYRAEPRAARERQLQHVDSVGAALCALVRVPLLGGTLSMMRAPARLAGLGELQSFLERGFAAFKAMPRPREFVATVVERERQLMERLYAGGAVS